MRVFSSILVIGSLIGFGATAQAQLTCDKSYGFRADVNGSTGQTLCASQVDAFLDPLGDFSRSNTGYTQTSAATVLARVNDVDFTLTYLANSTTLSYNFAQLGETGSFTGLSRQESQNQFEDFVKKNDIIGRIMNYQAKNSATSPITGVGGLIPTLISSDFDSNFTNSATAVSGPAQKGGDAGNYIGMGLSSGSYKVDGSGDDVKVTSIPLYYTIRNDIDPRRQLNISLPLTIVDVGGAKTFHSGLGLSYRIPMNDNWTLTPGGRYAVVASRDRATVSTVYSGSITSTYVIPMDTYDIAIGNMLGYYQTGKFSSGDYSFNPDIKNKVLRNGVMLSQPVNLGRKMSIEYSLVDTRYFGDKPYVDNLQEFSVTLGTNKNAQDVRSNLRAGLTFMRGRDTKGLTVNVGYWF